VSTTNNWNAHPVGCRSAGAGSPWKEINLGSYPTVIALREALKEQRILIGDLADRMLELPSFHVSSSVTRIKLMVLTATELGLGIDSTSFAQVQAHALKMGLDLCPPEVGPQLRLQYLAQKVGEYLLIGMKPLHTASRIDACFVVANGGAGLLLIGRLARSDLTVSSQSQFVFALRQQQRDVH